MKQYSQNWTLFAAAMLVTLSVLRQTSIDAVTAITTISYTNTDARRIVKKDQAISPPQQVVVAELWADSVVPDTVNIDAKQQHAIIDAGQNGHLSINNLHQEDVHVDRSNNMSKEDDFPYSFSAVFYAIMGLTSSAIFLLVVRIYRLRLQRAERKYGVQGDRTNHELTPLPMSIEDVNSDEDEDHTLFEVNRQSIRIL